MADANGSVSLEFLSGYKQRRPQRCVALMFALTWLLAGCAGQRQHFQALAPGAETTDGIRDSLVLMPLRVWPLQANLRLSGMHLVDTSTGDRHQLVFFENESLGSRALPQRKLEFELAQIAVLDLPPGDYRLVAVDLAFLWQKSAAGIATVDLERNLVLPVSAVPAYAGRLTVEVEVLTVTDDFGTRRYEFPLNEPVRLYSIDLQLVVEARVRVDDRFEQDRADAIVEFPGLETVLFEKSLLR